MMRCSYIAMSGDTKANGGGLGRVKHLFSTASLYQDPGFKCKRLTWQIPYRPRADVGAASFRLAVGMVTARPCRRSIASTLFWRIAVHARRQRIRIQNLLRPR